MGRLFLRFFTPAVTVLQILSFADSIVASESKQDWQKDWEQTVKAAEKEGQVTVEPYDLREGISISSAYGQVVLMNRAPHPNAAKVFINWLLSREGQTVFQKAVSLPEDPKDSRRVDIPKHHVRQPDRRKDGMKYFDLDDPEAKDIRPIIKLLDEVLGPRK